MSTLRDVFNTFKEVAGELFSIDEYVAGTLGVTDTPEVKLAVEYVDGILEAQATYWDELKFVVVRSVSDNVRLSDSAQKLYDAFRKWVTTREEKCDATKN